MEWLIPIAVAVIGIILVLLIPIEARCPKCGGKMPATSLYPKVYTCTWCRRNFTNKDLNP